jgi:NADH dehydrogenase
MSALGADASSPSAYARTKAKAEVIVSQSRLDWTIFRPSIIYGAGDSFFNKFNQISALAPVLPVFEGNTRFQPVWVEDVARAFISSIGNRGVAGQIFELGGPEAYSFRELLRMMLDTVHRKRLLIDVPRPIAKLMATMMQFLPTPPLTPDQLLLLQKDNVVKGEPFPAMFGQPARLTDVLPAFLAGNRATRLQHRLDRYRKHYWSSH